MKSIQGILFLALLLLPAAAWSKAELDLTKSTNDIEFLLIGMPSAVHIHGVLTKDSTTPTPVSGTLVFEGKKISGSAKLAPAAFDTSMAIRNKHMKKYLETDKFPQAELFLTTVDPKTSSFSGDLSLHGVKKPVSGKLTLEQTDKDVKLGFEFVVKMAEYGIKLPVFMGITAQDEVTVSGKISGALEQK